MIMVREKSKRIRRRDEGKRRLSISSLFQQFLNATLRAGLKNARGGQT
jgi:hypothetical protein